MRDGKAITLSGDAISPKAKQKTLVIEDLPADNPKAKLRTAWLKG